jgi:hypothetical protein
MRLAAGVLAITLAAIACRQGDPLEPKTPPNSPIPTKLDRPDDPPASPTGLPKIGSDAGSSK